MIQSIQNRYERLIGKGAQQMTRHTVLGRRVMREHTTPLIGRAVGLEGLQ